MQKSNPSLLRASTVRPAFVDWTGHEEIKPFLPEIGTLKSVAGSILSPMMNYVGKSKWSPTAPLGKFLTGMAMGMWDGALDGEGVEKLPGGFAVVNNPGFRRVMELDVATR